MFSNLRGIVRCLSLGIQALSTVWYLSRERTNPISFDAIFSCFGRKIVEAAASRSSINVPCAVKRPLFEYIAFPEFLTVDEGRYVLLTPFIAPHFMKKLNLRLASLPKWSYRHLCETNGYSHIDAAAHRSDRTIARQAVCHVIDFFR